MRYLFLSLLALLCLSIQAEKYTIIFNSGNADSSSKTTELTNIIQSATGNCVNKIVLANNIYRAKPNYGIKGGTASAKGELTLGLNTTYSISTLTVYAACYANKTDSTKKYGITVCDQQVDWHPNRCTDIMPYTLTLNRAVNTISISANNAKNNRWYVAMIEFELTTPQTQQASIEMPYLLDLGSQALVDGEPINDITNIQIIGRNIIGDIQLSLFKGTNFTIQPNTLPANGGEVNLSYHLNSMTKVEDTLIVSAKGSNGGLVTQKMPIKLSGYIYTPPVFDADSSCMAIGPMPGFYYEEAQGQQGEALKSKLGAIIHCGVRYKYGSGNKKTWDGFFHTDRDTTTNLVLDMYSLETRYFNSTKPTASVLELDIEHMFPKSWWGGDVNEAYCDLFHLVPADYSANRSKSNHAPGIPSDTTFWNGSFATGSGAEYGLQKVFCPADEYKGDFARAYFYIATCYGDSLQWQLSGDAGKAMTNEHWQEFQPWLRDLLVSWHRMDPVSDKEKQRAIEVNKIQGNRNPYIDYPELVEYIWGDKTNQKVDLLLLEQSYGHRYGENNVETAIPALHTPDNSIGKVLDGNRIIIIRNGSIYTLLGTRIL
jgi:hypothetical protein